MFYNKTKFEQQGLPDLYKLYKEDKWTWDEASKVFKAGTKDLNNDGIIDQNDQRGTSSLNQYAVIASNGATITGLNKEGKNIFTLDQPAALEALEQYTEWYQLRLSGGNFEKGTALTRWDYFGKGRNYMEMKDKWGIVPIPKGPRAKRYYLPENAPFVTVLPLNSKNPEAMMALRSFLFRLEDVPADIAMARQVRDRQTAELFRKLQNNWEGECLYLFESFGGKIVKEAIKQIRSGTKTSATAVAEIKPQVQAVLDDLYNK